MSGTKCINCGLPHVQNHHPLAGKPDHINTVGCPTGCLPCTEKRANGRRKVIVGLRLWMEDELEALRSDEECTLEERTRYKTLEEVLEMLNGLEEARRVAYVYSEKDVESV